MAVSDERVNVDYECDLIMKGGITSGIVYPPALVEIGKDHRFRSIAGTSAGAIGAAGAAAAELGRGSATGGFELLATLPDVLKETDSRGRTRLFRLFQPQRSVRKIFDLIWNVRRKGWMRVPRTIWDVLRFLDGWPGIAGAVVLAAGIGILVALLIVAGPWSLLATLPLLVVCLLGAAVLRAASVAPGALTANYHGLCNGMTPEGSPDAAVTEWLYDTLQALAGRGDEGLDQAARRRPVTFGELEAAQIDLVMLSTNVSRGTSETVPFRQRVWAYDEEEWKDLFPADVIGHLRENGAEPSRPDVAAALERQGLRMLPDSAKLPIIVGVRMSLAFPVLLSAIPIHGLTFEREGGEWVKRFRRNWFSDGGITSNLPVHLFDSALPRRPTYAINLSGGGHASRPAVDNIFRPLKPNQGRLPSTEDITGTVGLLAGVFDTMQNWTDNDLSRASGHKDRICTIRLGEGEGGMNLDMPADVIAGLVPRGEAAGDNLASIMRGRMRFAEPDGDEERRLVEMQWTNHRWTRFRVLAKALADYTEPADSLWGSPSTPDSYAALATRAGEGVDGLFYDHEWSESDARAAVPAFAEVFSMAGLSRAVIAGDDAPRGVELTTRPKVEPDDEDE